MKFKEWFVINEMSEIAKGPYLLYHGTSTGENNERLESFKREGAKPVGGGYGQGGGFFVSTGFENTKDHAFSLLKGDLPGNLKHIGKPMVVVIEMPEMDFKEWDLDIESNMQKILWYASRKLEKLPNQEYQFALSDKSKQYLDADKYGKDSKGEIIQHSNTEDYDKVKFNKGIPSIRFNNYAELDPRRSKNWDAGDINIGSAARIARAYYGHQDQSKGKHEKLEAWIFKKHYNKRDMSLKYTGTKPLPVKEILVFDNGEWKSV